MGFHRKITDGMEVRIRAQREEIERLNKELTSSSKQTPQKEVDFATQKVIDEAVKIEEKGKKFEADLERLKESLEKMVQQDPSGVVDDLD